MSLNLRTRKAQPSLKSTSTDVDFSRLETAWVISVAVVGSFVLVWGLLVGRFTEPVALAKYLLAWSMFVGLVPLPLQVMRRKLKPALRFICGAGVHIYVIATLLVALAAGGAVTWDKLAAPFSGVSEATRIILEGVGHYKK